MHQKAIIPVVHWAFIAFGFEKSLAIAVRNVHKYHMTVFKQF